MKFLIWVLAAVLGAGCLLWFFGPREPVVTEVEFDEGQLAGGIDAWLAAQESGFDDITDGTAKQVIWAEEPETKTDWSVVYLHGFSATSEEIRPLPDGVAQQLNANLVFTRLQGHGRSGDALAGATVEGWMRDVAEALAIGRATGNKTLIIGTSTGATLAALALHKDMAKEVRAVVMISPNFRVRAAGAQVLTWPGARWWLPKLAGAERSFPPSNDDHAKFWTNTYPTTALLPMAASVKAAQSLPHEQATQPALFVFDDLDQVIDHATTRDVAARWGGPTKIHAVDVGPGDDPGRHVIAGRVLSPNQTAPMTEVIVNWVKDLK
ncbi:alpha/beta fold hydrolase [uncultured Pelagimonas sp.]|uniref:alpha/beta hydrolase n=1 Tax=uncultured Pelagimonas sp. TaxID=1618102 RepID=UPI002608E29B|nr:alpha/beta fold hydrolase [uncultured Pelagimonas sp.]